MKEKIESIFSRVIPNALYSVHERTCSFSKSNFLVISIAASDYEINRVRGQYPARVSLSLELSTLELTPQIFGGLGGQTIFRLPNKEIESERFLALKSIKIPFRKPAKNETAILKAIEKFASNWREILKENIPSMPHKEECDYEKAVSLTPI